MPYKDPEKQREHSREYYEANKEKRQEYNREWRKANKERIQEYSREYSREYRKANKERIQEYKREWYKANKERLQERRDANKEKKREYNRKYLEANVEMGMLHSSKKRAKKRGLPFDLTIEDIEVPEFCPMLGTRLEVQKGSSSACSPSLDRIVPEKGYTKGNVQVISLRANRIKSDATADEIMAVAKYMKEQEDDSI